MNDWDNLSDDLSVMATFHVPHTGEVDAEG